MSKALKRKQNFKPVHDVTRNSFEKVVEKSTKDRNVLQGLSSIHSNSDDEDIELIQKKEISKQF